MPAHLTIVTGASRGMGLAIAQQLLDAGHDLLCISRKTSDALQTHADAAGRRCEQWPHDLAHAEPAAAKLEAWLAAQDSAALGSDTLGSATLINNAAIVPRIGPMSALPAADVAEALRINLEAPMLLTGAFLRATASWTAPRKVLNISSGLGRRPMASQAAYCAAKAGLDHFTRCVALEEAARPHGARVVSLAPGVIDTEMQAHLRATPVAQFPDVGNFIGMKDRGALASPQEAAARIVAFLARADFGANPVADVRDA